MRNELWKKISVGFVLFLFIALHLTLLHSTFHFDQKGNILTSYSGYGDIPFHLAQISKYAFGTFDLVNPFYLGSQLHYPFAINMLSGLLLRLTGAWTFAVQSPIFLLAIVNILLVYFLYKKLLANRFLALAGLMIFFIGFNLAPYYSFRRAFNNNIPLGQSIVEQINSYQTGLIFQSTYPDQNIVFSSPLSLVFLHQRSFLPGFFVFLVLLHLLLKVGEKKKKNPIEGFVGTSAGLSREPEKNHEKKTAKAERNYLVAAGIIYGLLPVIHMHTFIVATILLFVSVLYGLLHKNRKLLIVIVIGILVALPQVFILVDWSNTGSTSSGFIHPRLGWMTELAPGSANFAYGTGELSSLGKFFNWPYFVFTIMNFGPILILFLISAIVIYLNRKKLREEPWIFISIFSAGLILLVVESLRLQPWDFDNNKLLVYFQFLAVPIILLVVRYLYYKQKALTAIIVSIIMFAVVLSAIFDLGPRLSRYNTKSPVLFDTEAINLANYVKNYTGAGDVILTSISTSNPISSLAGRQLLTGYGGWLWTMGIEPKVREAELKNFYTDPQSHFDFINKYSIDYVLLDNQTEKDFSSSKKIFAGMYEKVYEQGQYSLYKM